MVRKWNAWVLVGVVFTAWTSLYAASDPLRVADSAPTWSAVREGVATFDFDPAVLDALGLRFIGRGQSDEIFTGSTVAFEILDSSTFEIGIEGEKFVGMVRGALHTRGALLLDKPGERVVIGNLAIAKNPDGAFTINSTLQGTDLPLVAFDLDSVMIDYLPAENTLRLIGEVSIARSWAPKLDIPRAAGTVIGTIVVDARMASANDGSFVENTGEGEDDGTDAGRFAEPLVPDVIVSDLQAILRYNDNVPGITAFAVATTACNIGSARAKWIAGTNEHPVIAQNAYRLLDGRFEQIGLSWVKHGFFAVSGSMCDQCLDPTTGSELGVGCSDPYSASLNGIQNNMSPRSIVNANTGDFIYSLEGEAETDIDRRMQVLDTDLDPALNPGARYFVQGHYVTPGDAEARTHNNNASYREVEVVELIEDPPGRFSLNKIDGLLTRRKRPAIRAWRDADQSVKEVDLQIENEGLFIVSAKVTSLGSGTWHYEYAVQNLNSDRAGKSFSVPLPAGVVATNIGFTDIDYHSGDPYDPTDWIGVAANDAVVWSSQDYIPPEDGNALRWGTIYNFRFDANAWSEPAIVTIGLFKPPLPLSGDPVEIAGESVGPTRSLIDCNGNSIRDECDMSCAAPGCEAPCGGSGDCDGNAVPDECQPDCNVNGTADECDVLVGTSVDCNGNSIPDECEVDCNFNGITDWCDINSETSEDCNWNDVPDECEIDQDSPAVGGPFFCTQDCAPDCNLNGRPDECDPDLDADDDRVFGCEDLCPFTNPGLKCGCNAEEDCCISNFCYSTLNLPPISPSECELLDGEPQCNLSPLCRSGCLIGDANDDGRIDLEDVAGLQLCFAITASEQAYAECLRIFDYNQDGEVDLEDFETFADLLVNGIP